MRVNSRELWFLGVGLLKLGCSPLSQGDEAQPSTVDMQVVFEVRSDGVQPVKGARIAWRGSVVGVSDSEGRIAARLRGQAGQRAALEVNCPTGFRAAEVPEVLTLRSFAALEEAEGLRVPVACEPLQRAIALVVQAERQADLPILARGREVGRTNADGVAHVLLSAEPGEEIAVELSTVHEPRLQPQNPRRSFRVSDRDDVFVVVEKFSLREPPRPRRTRVGRTPPRARPYAL